jgi:hypothetical protein
MAKSKLYTKTENKVIKRYAEFQINLGDRAETSLSVLKPPQNGTHRKFKLTEAKTSGQEITIVKRYEQLFGRQEVVWIIAEKHECLQKDMPARTKPHLRMLRSHTSEPLIETEKTRWQISNTHHIPASAQT